jgi:hypothetical protein
MSDDGFHNFSCLSVEKTKIKFLLASMKTLANSEKLFKKIVPAFS